MIKKILKKEKGFTLIELLAVIVILGIIAAIAIPAIGNVISNSRDNAALSEAQQIINGAKLYVAAENKNTSTETITYDQIVDEYVEKADTFTSVTITNGVYAIVGHTKANAAADRKNGEADAPTSLTEADINTLLGN